MVFIQNIHVLNCRSEKNSIFKTSIMNNPFVIITIVGSILLQIMVIKVSVLARFLKVTNISFKTIIMSFVFSCIIVVVAEIYKMVYRKLK